jgi:arylsulfatase A-like enzyme
MKKCILLILTRFQYIALLLICSHVLSAERADRPNILFCISDDQSWAHASAYGVPVLETPVFDKVAKQGALFMQAYSAAPSCTPARGAVLTGQDIWRIGEAGQLFGTLPAEHPLYTDLLVESGYHVGYNRKGWGPGKANAGGRTMERHPTGEKYITFKDFFEDTKEGQPWCFWFGSRDPHRGFKKGSGIAAGMNPDKVRVPDFLPDSPEVRSDMLDYFLEIQRFDREVGEILEIIEEAGQLENTIVVITSDNGMPFPRAKATLYDYGVRMPLAIQWPDQMPGGRVINDFVNLTDLAPTFLEAAGVEAPEVMSGRSLLFILKSEKEGRIEPNRGVVYTGRERHAWCRIEGLGYPARMIRTKDFLYIRNFKPDRMPAGDFIVKTNEGRYGDVDDSPSKRYMLENKEKYPRLYDLSFGKRPAEELYDNRSDPYQMKNLAEDPKYAETLRKLSEQLTQHLKATGDPRIVSGEEPWDKYEYHGRKWDPVPLK